MPKQSIATLEDKFDRGEPWQDLLRRQERTELEVVKIINELEHRPTSDELSKVNEQLAAMKADLKHMLSPLQVLAIIVPVCSVIAAIFRFVSH